MANTRTLIIVSCITPGLQFAQFLFPVHTELRFFLPKRHCSLFFPFLVTFKRGSLSLIISRLILQFQCHAKCMLRTLISIASKNTPKASLLNSPRSSSSTFYSHISKPKSFLISFYLEYLKKSQLSGDLSFIQRKLVRQRKTNIIRYCFYGKSKKWYQ